MKYVRSLAAVVGCFHGYVKK